MSDNTAVCLRPGDSEWPSGLNDIRTHYVLNNLRVDPLTEIWVRGKLPDLSRSVAIVGSRACTSYGLHVASDMSSELAKKGYVIVSGGAYGIDAAAHRGALAAGGITVAVLPCGLDKPYPATHADLFDRIVKSGGALVSEYPAHEPALRERFLARNRIIAALSRGMVMVEATVMSGSANALSWARKLNRAVMAVPGPVTSIHSTGTFEALRKGAIPVHTAKHVIDTIEVERIIDTIDTLAP